MRRAALALLLLAACGPAPVRVPVPQAPVGEPVAIAFAAVEVREVSLPLYAEGEDIFVQSGGGLSPLAGAQWADDPARALTLDLARALSDLTGARVAPEPWPFEEDAGAVVDVRVSEIVARTGAAGAPGAFVLEGQAYVGAREGEGRDSAQDFAIAVPLPEGAGPGAIAAARAEATRALARQIAERGLR